ncbi:sugar transferase [Peribacillus frigoritolerans]|uniref:sugar transferase n=1 Tax=Peribacillus frigoritolerans TaxID=450367 RepID=UPI003D0606E3
MDLRESNQYFSDRGVYNHLNSSKYRFYFALKNISDFTLALIGLIVTLPILLLFSLAIILETKGPAFFLQERVGKNGKLFYIIKLRSMYTNAEKNGAQWATKNDPRVTKVGFFIRKTRIDELPQLINILKGDMSLIGPRPERQIFTEQFNKEILGFKSRLAVKPGITGWAQVNGGYDITPKEKLILDLHYIKNLSFIIDIKIIFKTIKVVFSGDGAR